MEQQKYTAMIKTTFTLIFAIFLFGCTASDGDLSIIDSSDFSYPTFCISKKSNCKGEPVNTAIGYNFEEIDNSGKFIRTVWSIYRDHSVDSKTKYFQYGKIPRGWKQDMIALPLELTKYYRIGGAFVYTCNSLKSCKIIELQNFYNGQR